MSKFQPGQSGNPGGKAKRTVDVVVNGETVQATIIDLALPHAVKAIQALAEIYGDATAPKAARVSAAVALLDRAFGRPKQTLANDEENPLPPAQITIAQVIAALPKVADEC